MDAVTSYQTLKDAIAGMLKRDGDTQITENTALFIQLCESDLYDRLLLRDEETEGALTAATSSAVIALPSDYISPIALWLVIDGERTLLRQVQPQELPYDTENGTPAEYAIDGGYIRFDCPAASAYAVKFRHVRKTVLSDSAPSNYLLTRRPDIYLYGSLKQAALFTEDDTATAKYSALYELGISAMANTENRNRRVPMRTDMPGTGPRSNILTGA